jgi:hypothetical protein
MGMSDACSLSLQINAPSESLTNTSFVKICLTKQTSIQKDFSFVQNQQNQIRFSLITKGFAKPNVSEL